MNSISIQNLSKTYPTSFPRLKKLLGVIAKPPVEALRNISFEIANGEVFGLIGRNGAGKTTLTKIIATLVQPTSGAARIMDFDTVRDEVKVRSLIGLATAEERSFYWRLTCEQNMLFFSRLYGMKDFEARKKIGEVFERLNLTALSKRRFSELSTGNKQRLAVARALLPSPPILLLDEPTRSLDPLAAADLRALIASLENVSILLTSHNLAEVEELCNRVAVISGGEIRALDTPANLRRAHRQTQRVTIFLKDLTEEQIRRNPALETAELNIEKHAEMLAVTFSRDAEDDLLGKTISLLTQTGGKILDVETENPTLLDVLESYE